MRMAETSTWAVTHPGYFLRAGVIDPDYWGEVTALITFIGPEDEGLIEKKRKSGQNGCGVVSSRPLPLHLQIANQQEGEERRLQTGKEQGRAGIKATGREHGHQG